MMNNFAPYIGSFIGTKHWWNKRFIFDIPPEYQLLYEAIEACHLNRTEPNARNVATQLALVNNLDFETVYNEVVNISRFGAQTAEEFRAIESAMAHVSKDTSMAGLQPYLAELLGKGLDPDTIAASLRRKLDEIEGQFYVPAHTANWDTQLQTFAQIKEDAVARIGKTLKCFPLSWGIGGLIRSIEPGRLITFTGGSGDGKSSMGMQYCEWQAKCGYNVLVIHLEDPVEVILQRQTCRWIPDTTMEELEGGDPDGKLEKMAALRATWKGQITYEYCANMTSTEIIAIIERHCSAGRIDDILVDYFQKINFVREVSLMKEKNVTALMLQELAVDHFKQLCEKWNNNVYMISQETEGENGESHARGTRTLEHKAQMLLQLERKKITKDEDVVSITIAGEPKPRIIAGLGSRSPHAKLIVKKANNHREGSSWGIFDGPHFKFQTKQYFELLRDKPELADVIPVFTAFDAKKREMQLRYQRRFDNLYEFPNPDEVAQQKKREKDGDKIFGFR